MTDREQDQAEALAERTLHERIEDVERHPVGEEFDPDAIRQVPLLDEDGNVVDEEIIDDVHDLR